MANSASDCCRCCILFLFVAIVFELAARIPVNSMQADQQVPYKFEPAYVPLDLENYTIPEVMNAPFQLCLPCKCCAATSPTPTCTNMPCCFGIDCQIPNKPFGFCAFVPKTCNCTSCAAV